MENLCHTFAGAALSKAGLERWTPLALPTLLVSANLPDLDVLTMLHSQMAYLEHHRGVSHSIIGVLVLSIGLTLLVTGYDRWIRRRRHPDAEPTRPVRVLLVSLIGTASHPLLDFTNNYGIRPFAPWNETWYYGDLVFIVDPWLWLILGGSVFLLTSQTTWRLLLWCGLWGLLTVAVISSHVGPVEPRFRTDSSIWLWVPWLAGLLFARWAGAHRYGSKLAVAALLITVAYWGTLAVAHAIALQHTMTASQRIIHDQPTSRHAAMPRPATPLEWEALFETSEAIFCATISIIHQSDANWQPQRYNKNLDNPLVQRALATCAGVIMQRFSRYLFAEVEYQSDEPSAVILRDARYQRRGTSGFSTVVIPLSATQQQGTSATRERCLQQE